MLIDCHSHLHVRDFDVDRAEVIERAKNSGIAKIINVGFDVEGNFKALALAKKHDFIFATFGIHPHGASEWNDEVAARIFETAKNEPKIVALGEMGLDYFKNFQPEKLQKQVFRAQLKLARELNLPVIIHCRGAFADVFKILKAEKIVRVLLHCFTGTLSEATEAWKRGFFTAFTGIVTYPSAVGLRYVVAKCPADKLLIETDCPYLAPQKQRGKRNEPAFLTETFLKIRDVRKSPDAYLQQQLAKNASLLFGI